jgi:hypothetical protein
VTRKPRSNLLQGCARQRCTAERCGTVSQGMRIGADPELPLVTQREDPCRLARDLSTDVVLITSAEP